MGTARQAVITPRMSSTLVLTAGCASTTRRWRSSTSTRWWSRLQSAPLTCCTTAASTCCRHTHHTHPDIYASIPEYIHKHTKHTCSKCTRLTVHVHVIQTHTKLTNRNTAQLVLLQDFPLLPSCPCFPENQLFQHPFPCLLDEEKQAAFTKISLWLLSLLCAPLLCFFCFVFSFSFYF